MSAITTLSPRFIVHAADSESIWWHDEATPARPALERDLEADVCVVGLGGSGLAAVLEARRLGARVVGVDAGRIAGAAAGRNGGLLLGGLAEFHHDVRARVGASLASGLYRHTLEELQRMRAASPRSTWWRGSLRIADTDQEWADCERQFAAMREDGLPVEWHEGPEGRGLRFPADGASHPVRRVLALAARAEKRGAQLFEHSKVRELTDGNVELENGARIRAPDIVVCADGALASLVPDAGPLVRQARLQMLATAPAHDVAVPRPVYARYGYDYWQQLPDGRIALGGGRDRFEAAEWTDSDRPSEALQSWLEQRLREAVKTAAPVTHRWAATVTFTPDHLPIAQSFGNGLMGAGGYSGTGNVVGALCARGLVRRALGRQDAFLELLDRARAATTVST